MRNKIGFVILVGLIILSLLAIENTALQRISIEIADSLLLRIKNSNSWQIIAAIFTIIFTLTIIFIATVIILENRNPSITLSWLLVLIFLPVLGFIFYLTFGRNYRKKKLVKNKEILNDHINKLIAKNATYLPPVDRVVKLILRNSNSPFTENNSTKILTNGEETFAEIIRELESAQSHIHLEYYIIQDDKIGQKIKEILIRKALSGVEVRLIYDGVGSRKLSLRYITSLKNAGVEVKCFLPVVMPFLNSKINYRNHRKIIVIDGKIGFVGGLNIGDEYLGRNKQIGFWRDTHIKLVGDAVYFLQNIFIQDWLFCGGKLIKKEKYFPKITSSGNTMVQIAASGPDSEWETIMQVYFTIITSAEKKVQITSPYLIPDDSILTALKTAALRGVDVKIIVPGKPDKYVVYWASQSYFEELLAAGVKIYQYERGFVHAKLLVVDGIIASIGTANMDIRSFKFNFEINALVYDQDVCRRLEKDFYNDLQHSREIIMKDFIRRPLRNKIKESISRLLSPLL